MATSRSRGSAPWPDTSSHRRRRPARRCRGARRPADGRRAPACTDRDAGDRRRQRPAARRAPPRQQARAAGARQRQHDAPATASAVRPRASDAPLHRRGPAGRPTPVRTAPPAVPMRLDQRRRHGVHAAAQAGDGGPRRAARRPRGGARRGSASRLSRSASQQAGRDGRAAPGRPDRRRRPRRRPARRAARSTPARPSGRRTSAPRSGPGRADAIRVGSSAGPARRAAAPRDADHPATSAAQTGAPGMPSRPAAGSGAAPRAEPDPRADRVRRRRSRPPGRGRRAARGRRAPRSRTTPRRRPSPARATRCARDRAADRVRGLQQRPSRSPAPGELPRDHQTGDAAADHHASAASSACVIPGAIAGGQPGSAGLRVHELRRCASARPGRSPAARRGRGSPRAPGRDPAAPRARRGRAPRSTSPRRGQQGGVDVALQRRPAAEPSVRLVERDPPVDAHARPRPTPRMATEQLAGADAEVHERHAEVATADRTRGGVRRDARR